MTQSNRLFPVVGLLVIGLFGACSSNSGAEPPADSTTVSGETLSGVVVDVAPPDDGIVWLTVRQPDSSEVFIEILERQALSWRVREGDRIYVDDRSMASDGERLRVRNLRIERGE